MKELLQRINAAITTAIGIADDSDVRHVFNNRGQMAAHHKDINELNAVRVALSKLLDAYKEEKFYLIEVTSGIEPDLLPDTSNPFAVLDNGFISESDRDAFARRRHEKLAEEDVLFWLDVKEGKPSVGAYSGAFFEEDADENMMGCTNPACESETLVTPHSVEHKE